MRVSTTSRAHQERHVGRQLPIILDEGAKIGGGIGALLFGGIFAAFPILLFLMSDWTDESIPLPAYVLLAVFLAVGIGIMALGVSAFLHKVEIGIDKRDVVGLRRSIKGTRTWRDSLAMYSGLFAEEEYHSGGKNRSSYTLYKAVFKHREDAHRHGCPRASLNFGELTFDSHATNTGRTVSAPSAKSSGNCRERIVSWLRFV